MLTQGKYEEACKRAEEALCIAKDPNRILAIAHCHLIMGCSQLLLAGQRKTSDLSLAVERLENAAKYLRLTAKQDELPRGLLARAALYCQLGRFDQAQQDLDEVLTSAEYGKMRLFEAEAHLEYAQLHIARGDQKRANESALRSRVMTDSLGYERLSRLLVAVEKQLKH